MQIRQMLCLIVTCSLISCSSSNEQNKQQANPQQDLIESSEAEIKKNILFFGNSLTAGQGLDSQDDAFPALIQHKIDSLDLPYQVINAGLSGETSAGGNERIDWILKQPVDIFVLELGANDGLRGVSTETTYQNLESIIKKVKAKYPTSKLVLAGMLVPPSMGATYEKQFRELFPKLAKAHQMSLIPFLLEDVAGDARLNQRDGIHPTASGQKIVADNVWKVLEPLLDQ